MAKENNLIIYNSFNEAIQNLSDENAGKLLKILLHYNTTSEVLDCNELVKFAFLNMKNLIDEDKQKYKLKCEKNRQNGIKSGFVRRNKIEQSLTSVNERLKNEPIKENKIKENKIKENKVKENKTFIKPTLEEINNFIIENNLKVNTETFYYYYEANGWKIGKVAMKNWQATLRQWNARENKKIADSSPYQQEEVYNAYKQY